MLAEFSCGGVVVDGRRVLLVCVNNLKNRKVWTLPKGHAEKDEGPRQAALREVLEETGYRCAILAPLLKVHYCFTLNGVFVKKLVQWYLMRRIAKSGVPDAAEILEIRWVSFEKAGEMLKYPSDKRLVAMAETLCRQAPRKQDL